MSDRIAPRPCRGRQDPPLPSVPRPCRGPCRGRSGILLRCRYPAHECRCYVSLTRRALKRYPAKNDKPARGPDNWKQPKAQNLDALDSCPQNGMCRGVFHLEALGNHLEGVSHCFAHPLLLLLLLPRAPHERRRITVGARRWRTGRRESGRRPRPGGKGRDRVRRGAVRIEARARLRSRNGVEEELRVRRGMNQLAAVDWGGLGWIWSGGRASRGGIELSFRHDLARSVQRDIY